VDAKSSGIVCTLLKTLAGDKQCELVFDDVKITQQNLLGKPGHGWDHIEKVLPKIAIAKCAEMIGGAQQVLDMAVDYAKERKQFGHPIGSYQAMQHYCANMSIAVDSSRLITYQAAWMLNEGLPCIKEVSIAKAWVGEAYHQVSMLAAEIHASIGLSMDHDLPLYYRRAKAAELIFGDSDFHKEIVAREAGL
jgi:alkylation response protein AidB-like acyl-CoA dehydrogenase